MPQKVILLCVLLLLSSGILRAEVALQITPATAQEHNISLEPYFSYFYDADGSLTIDDIRLLQLNWQPLKSIEDGYFGISHGAVWLTMDIHSTLPDFHASILDLRYAYLDYVYFYVERNGTLSEFKSGRKVPVAEWPLLSRKIAFPVDLSANDKVRLYIRIASEAPVVASPRLMSRNEFSSIDRQSIVILSIYLGMVLALAIYNLLLAMVIRRTQFLLYSCFIVLFGLAISVMTGIEQLLFPGVSSLPTWFVPFMFCLSFSTSLFFARKFLSLRVYSPDLDLVLRVLGFSGFFLAAIVLFIDVQKAIIIVTVQSLITTITLLSIGAYAIYREIFAARIFFSAWFVMFLAFITLTLRNYGFLHSNFFSIYSVQIGSALEMMILAYALAVRINETRRMKDIAQKSLLTALKEQETILENRVMQRTQELQLATTALERLATEDALTGLLNRRGLEMRYNQLEKMGRRLSLPVAVALIDLDDFKPVNDQYGHEASDELLSIISQRLLHGMRETDAVGRLGGDEFVYLSLGHYTEDQLLTITDRLRHEISAPVEVDTYVEVQVGASIGVCYSHVENESFQSLLRLADEAMYQVKHQGKHGVYIINNVNPKS